MSDTPYDLKALLAEVEAKEAGETIDAESDDWKPAEVFGPPRPERPSTDGKIQAASIATAVAWCSGYLLAWSGIAGFLAHWFGASAWWLVALGAGVGAVAAVGLVPLRAVLYMGIRHFPIRHWR